MPELPEYMRLSGDEDCGVSLLCYHSACDPYHHGEVAYYGEPMVTKPSFKTDQLGAFLDFIVQHAQSHGESF
jgi:hypothetical protein